MNTEIERKFLVNGPFKHLAVKQLHVIQGYLSIDSERTVRIRTCDEKAFITIKGKTNDSGMSRMEFETEIPKDDAEQLMKLSIGYLIEKIRYYVPAATHLFEVDEFKGVNEGLVIAELELGHEEEEFEKPEWLGEEVTGKKKYYNSNLILNPYISN
jgi:adenylate cyclase